MRFIKLFKPSMFFISILAQRQRQRQRKMKTDDLLKFQRKEFPSRRRNNAISYIASFFSVMFSMSLAEQAVKFIDDNYVLILVVLFIILFLVFNEYHKVIELRKRFLGHKNNLFIIVFAFTVNIAMSGIGIHLWVNKSFEDSIKNSNTAVNREFLIEQKYNLLIDSVLNAQPKSAISELKNDLNYWKSRKPANLEERAEIRNEISLIQDRIDSQIEEFQNMKKRSINNLETLKNRELSVNSTMSNNKQKYISRYNNIAMVFFVMVILTKLIILFLAKEWADIERSIQSEVDRNKSFIEQYKIITEILLRVNEISYNSVRYSEFNMSDDEGTKKMYYLFGELDILKNTSLEEAQTRLKNYYETLLNI